MRYADLLSRVRRLLAEVITSAEFHPSHCNVLAYSSSKGAIRLADMRASALCDKHAKQ
jgi:serine/threonine-protein phosphatase 2A regulatory subunit B